MSKIKECQSCQKKFGIFRWRNTCKCCDLTICSDCTYQNINELEDDFSDNPYNPILDKYCDSCGGQRSSELVKLKNELENIIVVKSSYVGNHKIVEEFAHLSTDKWVNDSQKAIKNLKYKALMLGANAIVNLEINKNTDSKPGKGKGTHYYSVFKVAGKPVIVTKYKSSDRKQNNLASELEKLSKLLNDGVLTQEEFQAAKTKLISS